MPTNPDAIERARGAWTYRGQQRPPFAVIPGPGQESVWDYPRPPAYLPEHRRVEIFAGESLVAATDAAIRVCETGGPPNLYLPPTAVATDLLIRSSRKTFCEWKGEASYFHVQGTGRRIDDALWCYPDPFPEAASIAGYFSCYPALLRCVLAGETVRAQPGGYYGGWITDEVVGPFKGEPGVPNR